MNLLIIEGSPFPVSKTEVIAEEIKSQIEQPEHKVDIVKLSEWDIPILGSGKTEDVEKLKRLAEEADAFIIGTPNYHTSFSGALKNVLDHLSTDEFEMKPVGLFCVSGGMRNTDPLTQLRLVMRGLHGLTIPTQISAADADFEKDESGHPYLYNQGVKQRISVMIDSLTELVYKVK
ncbi:NADPH-dependent FMN reductase [Corticicoccus populi]|uniref:FMN-dependent NADPH-azoreductase n=1 Tax=Corticicoccus populi TaxID=1812821 RepID=A0ABW5WX95_9STAP